MPLLSRAQGRILKSRGRWPFAHSLGMGGPQWPLQALHLRGLWHICFELRLQHAARVVVEHVARFGDGRLDTGQWHHLDAACALALALRREGLLPRLFVNLHKPAALCAAQRKARGHRVLHVLGWEGVAVLKAARRSGALAERIAARAIRLGLGNVRAALAEHTFNARVALNRLAHYHVDVQAAQARAIDKRPG